MAVATLSSTSVWRATWAEQSSSQPRSDFAIWRERSKLSPARRKTQQSSPIWLAGPRERISSSILLFCHLRASWPRSVPPHAKYDRWGHCHFYPANLDFLWSWCSQPQRRAPTDIDLPLFVLSVAFEPTIWPSSPSAIAQSYTDYQHDRSNRRWAWRSGDPYASCQVHHGYLTVGANSFWECRQRRQSCDHERRSSNDRLSEADANHLSNVEDATRSEFLLWLQSCLRRAPYLKIYEARAIFARQVCAIYELHSTRPKSVALMQRK